MQYSDHQWSAGSSTTFPLQTAVPALGFPGVVLSWPCPLAESWPEISYSRWQGQGAATTQQLSSGVVLLGTGLSNSCLLTADCWLLTTRHLAVSRAVVRIAAEVETEPVWLLTQLTGVRSRCSWLLKLLNNGKLETTTPNWAVVKWGNKTVFHAAAKNLCGAFPVGVYMGDFIQGGERLLKNGTIFFYGKINTSLNISTDGLQPTCRYQLRVSRGPHNSLGHALVELV